MVFKWKKNNVKSQWEKQVTQARKQTKGQLNRMAQQDRYYDDDLQADVKKTPTYDQSYGAPYYRYNGGNSITSRNMSNIDDGNNTYEGMNTYEGDGTYNTYDGMNTYEGDGTYNTYDGMNTYQGDGTITSYQGSAINTYDGMNTYEGDGNNTYDGMNSYQQGSAINTYDGMDSQQGSAINTYDGMNSYQQGSAINTYDGMDSQQGSAINTYDGMNSYQQGSAMNTYDGMNSYQGSAINAYDGMNSYQGSGANMFGGMNSYQGSGMNTYDGMDSYQQGSGVNMFGQANPYGSQADSFQHGGMAYGKTEDAYDGRRETPMSQSQDGSILKKGPDRQFGRKNSFRKGLKKIAKVTGKKKDKDDPSFMTLPTPDTYMDPDTRDDEEEQGTLRGREGLAAVSKDGDTVNLMRRMQLKEEATRASSNGLIDELLSNPILACAAAPIIPCLVCYARCNAPPQATVDHRESNPRRSRNEKQPTKTARRHVVDLESVNNESYQQNNFGNDNHGNNISGTFEEQRNVPEAFDNAQGIPRSHSRSSRLDIDSRASEFSRILSAHASGDRSLGLNSRATEYSNIVSEGGNEQEPWKKKSSSFNSRKTEYSAIQSSDYGYGNTKQKSTSFHSKKTEYSAIQSHKDHRQHNKESFSKASTKASEFSRIDSRASKASEFSRIDSDDDGNARQGRGSRNKPQSSGGGTYGHSTNQSGSRPVPRTGNLWGGDESASGKSGKISKLTFDGTYGGDISTRPGTGGSRKGNLWNNFSEGTTGAGDASNSRGGGSIMGNLWNNFSGATSGKNSSKYTAENHNFSYASQGSYGTGKWVNKVNDTFSKAGDGETYGSQSNADSRFTDNNDDESLSAIEEDAMTVQGTIGTFDDDGGYSYRSESQGAAEMPQPRRRTKSPFKKMFRKKARE